MKKINNLVNVKISGLYDIGKEFSLNIYASNDDNFKELEENVPKKIKDVIIEKQVNGFQFRSYNLTTILRLQKSLGFNFKLEHV
jgi:hypothetical protein